VGAISLFESDVGSAALEATVDEALNDAVQVVEDYKIELEERHVMSSSSDSDAESLEYDALVKILQPPTEPSGFHFMQHKRTRTLHLADAKYPHGTCCGRVLYQNLQSPRNLGMTLQFAMCAEGIRWLEAALELNQKGRVKR